MKRVFQNMRLIVFFLASLGLLAGQLGIAAPVFAQATTISTAMKAEIQTQQKSGEAVCAQPPAGINLMTLSDTQLAYYGLPLHATLNADPTRWAAVLARAQHRGCSLCGIQITRSHTLPFSTYSFKRNNRFQSLNTGL